MHLAMSACDYVMLMVDEVPKLLDLIGSALKDLNLLEDNMISKLAGHMSKDAHYLVDGDLAITFEGGMPVHELHDG